MLKFRKLSEVSVEFSEFANKGGAKELESIPELQSPLNEEPLSSFHDLTSGNLEAMPLDCFLSGKSRVGNNNDTSYKPHDLYLDINQVIRSSYVNDSSCRELADGNSERLTLGDQGLLTPLNKWSVDGREQFI